MKRFERSSSLEALLTAALICFVGRSFDLVQGTHTYGVYIMSGELHMRWFQNVSRSLKRSPISSAHNLHDFSLAGRCLSVVVFGDVGDWCAKGGALSAGIAVRLDVHRTRAGGPRYAHQRRSCGPANVCEDRLLRGHRGKYRCLNQLLVPGRSLCLPALREQNTGVQVEVDPALSCLRTTGLCDAVVTELLF